MEIKGAADKLATMMNSSQPQANVFYQPDNLGALPHLWLQAKLTISLTSMQEKFARLFLSIASELWLRGAIDTVEEVFAHAARSFTLRLAETLSQYICSLTRRAESLATPETECLLYATFWFRPILSELIVAAKESAEVNRKRAPSGPVKVVVTNQPHSRRHTGKQAGPPKPHRRFPSPVPIEYLRGCREKRLIKYCRQLNLLTKTLQD